MKKENDCEEINCGLIMPIAPMPDYDYHQFKDVQNFLKSAIEEIQEYNFNVRLVSESGGEIDVIHRSIVNNINKDPIVICDISGRNGNVMLELGLRLAFDKPVIIIKDDKTDYMFDINMIKHLNYPSDLRHNKMLEFQKELKQTVIDTYEKSLKDPSYSPFLKHFKEIKIADIGEESIGLNAALSNITNSLDLINERLYVLENTNRSLLTKESPIGDKYYSEGTFNLNKYDPELTRLMHKANTNNLNKKYFDTIYKNLEEKNKDV